MKNAIAISILFCLVFLNVPRSFVHDCDHDAIEHAHEDSDSNLSIESDNDSCFVCEFDLGFFDHPDFKISSFAKYFDYTFIASSVDYLDPESFFAFSHRGPPVV